MSIYPEIPEQKEPDQKRRPHGCLIAITIIVIISLIGSALVGVAWLFLREQEKTNEPIEEPVAAATSPPQETEAPFVVDEPTAVNETPVPTPTKNPEDITNRIVFIDDEGQIITVSPDGSEARTLTDGSEVFRFPAWSPDGKKIAAISSTNLGSSVIVMQDAAESNLERLYFGDRRAPFYLYWSPDSQTISFLANDRLGMGLHLVPADGSAESRLRTTGGPFYWHWTADSEQLLIHSGFSGPGSRLELIDASGEEAGEQIADPGYFQAPGISADGHLLAYAEVLDELSSQVVVADTTSGGNQTEKHAGQTAMSFSPTTNQLAYISPDSPEGADFIGPLKMMDVDSGEIKLLSREPVLAFFWSPDGRFIAAFVAENLQGEEINASLSEPKRGISAKPAPQFNLPTFRLIIFDVEMGQGKVVLNFTPTITFLTQFMPFFDQYALSHRIWSPDSDAIVLPVLEDGRSQIYIVPTQGGQAQYLAPGSMAFWSHQ